jgi:hypothetical protein
MSWSGRTVHLLNGRQQKYSPDENSPELKERIKKGKESENKILPQSFWVLF